MQETRTPEASRAVEVAHSAVASRARKETHMFQAS